MILQQIYYIRRSQNWTTNTNIFYTLRKLDKNTNILCVLTKLYICKQIHILYAVTKLDNKYIISTAHKIGYLPTDVDKKYKYIIGAHKIGRKAEQITKDRGICKQIAGHLIVRWLDKLGIANRFIILLQRDILHVCKQIYYIFINRYITYL